jgi:tetratricopeptide (TPR) repeat protein
LGDAPPSAPQNAPTANVEEDRCYLQAHEAEHEAQAAFQHVVEMAPDSYRAHQIAGDASAAGEKFEEAIEEYQAVLKQKPDLPGIHEAIGTAKLKRGKLDDALSEFEAELQIQPRSAGVHTNVAQVLILMVRDDEARKHLETALGLYRFPPEVYLLLGKLDLNRKDYRSAVATLTHYLSLKKSDSTGYYLLARA